jgi:flagellar basal-body rod protein FlgC
MIDGTPPIGIRRPMRGLGIAASGLRAQRTRLDVIAQNIANAETTRGTDGRPYRRRSVELREVGQSPILLRRSADDVPVSFQDNLGGVEVAGVVEDPSEGQLVYDPGHPDADEGGYVIMPNVSINEEIVDMMEARRLFDANASVFQAIKSMLHRATQL